MRRMGCTEYEVHICTYNTSTLLAPRELLHLENTESERACKCGRSCDFGLSCSPPCPLALPVPLSLGHSLSTHVSGASFGALPTAVLCAFSVFDSAEEQLRGGSHFSRLKRKKNPRITYSVSSTSYASEG